MKKFTYRFSLILIILSLALACGKGSGPNMTGTWKAVDVKIDFDEQMSTPEMLKQVAEREKQTYLKFLNDSTLNIVAGESTFTAYWVLDKESGVINYRFVDMGIQMTELGKYQDGSIIAESSTPLGKITITYKKED